MEAWRAALGFSHDVRVRPEDRHDFRASFDGYSLGAVLVADLRASRCTAVRDRALIARHALDHIALDLLVAGRLTGAFGTRSVTAGPGDCVMLDLKQTMQIDLTDHRCLSLIVPRAVFTAWGRPSKAVGGHVFGAGSPEARLLGGFLEQLVALAPDLPEGAAAAAGFAGVDLVHACLASPPAAAQPRAAKPPRRDVARIERFIERNIANEGLGPDLLAARFGLSRASLYRLLAPRGGVAHLIRHHRLAYAHRLLTTDLGRGLSSDEIARRSGLGTARTLRRGLRDTFDASARGLRARGAEPGLAPPPLRIDASAWIDAE